MAVAIRSLLTEIKTFSGLERAVAYDAQVVLRSSVTGIAAVDQALRAMTVFKASTGFLRVGEASFGRLGQIIRQANLPELVRLSRANIPITRTDEQLFRNIVPKTPDLRLRDLETLTTANRAKYPQLDVKTTNAQNLSTAAAADIEKVERNIAKNWVYGTTIPLTIGVFVVGVKATLKAMAVRKGCFMHTLIDGKSTSCKVQAYSCIGDPDAVSCNMRFDYYNVTLVLMKVVTLTDDDARKKSIADATGIPIGELNDRLPEIISQHYEKAAGVIKGMKDRPTFNICEIKHPGVENNKVPPCRMCSPSDNPVSTSFIDPSQYPDNVTFSCSVDPSAVEVLTDVVLSTGRNIWQGVSGGILRFLKPIAIYGIIILVLVALIIFMYKFVQKRAPKEETQPLKPPPPPQQRSDVIRYTQLQ